MFRPGLRCVSMVALKQAAADYITETERGGFERIRIAQLFTQLYLQQKACNFKNLDALESLLSSHGFLL